MDSIEVLAARAGQHVLYVADNAPARRLTLDKMSANDREITRVQRTTGSERIDYASGGRITFIGSHPASITAGRGQSADVISMSAEAANDNRVVNELTPCIHASNIGRVIIRA